MHPRHNRYADKQHTITGMAVGYIPVSGTQ